MLKILIKLKPLVFLLIVILPSFLAVNFVLAQEKQEEQKDPFGIQKIYTPLVIIGIALSGLAMLYGGIRFVLAVGDPDQINEAKQWLAGGVFGLFLVVCASAIYAILVGNNIPLTQLKRKEPAIKSVFFGVYLCVKKGCPMDYDFDRKIAFPHPEACQGPFFGSISDITAILGPKEPVKSIKIINDFSQNVRLGVYGFNHPNFEGNTWFRGGAFTTNEQTSCLDVETYFSAKRALQSLAILNLPEDPSRHIAGQWIMFYQDAHYRGGYSHPELFKDSSLRSAFSNNRVVPVDLNQLTIHYRGTDTSPDTQERCPFFYAPRRGEEKLFYCLGSVKINGYYGVVLIGNRVTKEKGEDKTTQDEHLFLKLYIGPNDPINLTTEPIWRNARPQLALIFSFIPN